MRLYSRTKTSDRHYNNIHSSQSSDEVCESWWCMTKCALYTTIYSFITIVHVFLNRCTLHYIHNNVLFSEQVKMVQAWLGSFIRKVHCIVGYSVPSAWNHMLHIFRYKAHYICRYNDGHTCAERETLHASRHLKFIWLESWVKVILAHFVHLKTSHNRTFKLDLEPLIISFYSPDKTTTWSWVVH